MNCPYCDAELVWEDSYGSLGFIQGREEKTGDIYRYPNHEGFTISEDVDVVCPSATHNVSGSFYTDRNGDLHEGYPC